MPTVYEVSHPMYTLFEVDTGVMALVALAVVGIVALFVVARKRARDPR